MLQSQPNHSLCRHTWASFKLTGGDAPTVSVLQDGAQRGLITPASIPWDTWVHPAAHAELHTTKDTLLAVPELRESLDIPGSCSCVSGVWACLGNSHSLPALNSELFKGPPLTAGTKWESQIVSYDFKGGIYMTTISNVCMWYRATLNAFYKGNENNPF